EFRADDTNVHVRPGINLNRNICAICFRMICRRVNFDCAGWMFLFSQFFFDQCDCRLDSGRTIRLARLEQSPGESCPQGAECPLELVVLCGRWDNNIYSANSGVLSQLSVESNVRELVLIVRLYFGLHLCLEVAVICEELQQCRLRCLHLALLIDVLVLNIHDLQKTAVSKSLYG